MDASRSLRFLSIGASRAFQFLRLNWISAGLLQGLDYRLTIRCFPLGRRLTKGPGPDPASNLDC